MSSNDRRLAAFGLSAALLSSFGQTFFIGLFGADVRQAYGLTEDSYGAIYGAATLASGLLMFWLGGIADRHAMRNAASLALGLLAAGCAAMAAAPSVAVLVAALFLLRLGGQGLLGHLAVVAAARGTALRRGRTVAWAAAGFIVGEAVFPALATATSSALGWRNLWWLATLCLLAGGIPALRRLAGRAGPPARDGGEAGGGAGPVRRRGDLFRRPAFLAALSVLLVPAFVVTAVFFHLSTLAGIRGWSPWQLSGAFALFASCQGVATVAAGRLVDRFGAAALVRFLLAPLGLGLAALALVEGAASLWPLFAGMGLTAGANAVVAGAVWAELFGIARLGLVRGVYAALMVLSSAASPPLLGLGLAGGAPLTLLCLPMAIYALAVPPAAGILLRHHR